ncbi:hypothetical protein C8Q76DRAFT_793610 [Earliella scabrosa]|nr:hypothetical protein C8Q76DRAFT_793610 [Earliella scabrosa]
MVDRTPRHRSRRLTLDRQMQDASASAIRAWNRDITARYRESREHRLIKALLYPVGDHKAHLLVLPIHIPNDDDPQSASWAEDPDVSHWFPVGVRYVRVSTIPATGFHLTNDYTILTSTFHRNGPCNRCIDDVLGLSIRGNILVMRHSSSRPMSIVNIHPAERRLIDLVILR